MPVCLIYLRPRTHTSWFPPNGVCDVPVVGGLLGGLFGSCFGPFQNLAGVIATVVPAAGAIIATWWGKTKWHPTGEIVERIAGALTAVAILLLSVASLIILGGVALAGGLVAAVCGLAYAERLDRWTYKIPVPTTKKDRFRIEKVVGGDWTEDSNKRRAAGESVDDIARDNQFKFDEMWTRESRAHNISILSRWYVPTIVGGSAALSSAALLFTRITGLTH